MSVSHTSRTPYWPLYSSSLFLGPVEWEEDFSSYGTQLRNMDQHKALFYQNINECWSMLQEHATTQRVIVVLPLTSRLFSNDSMSVRDFMARFEKSLQVQHVLFVCVDHDQSSALGKPPKKMFAFKKEKVLLGANMSRASFIMHLRSASAADTRHFCYILSDILSASWLPLPTALTTDNASSTLTTTQFLSPLAPYYSIRYINHALQHALRRLPQPPLAPKLYQLHETPQADMLFENWKFAPFVYGDSLNKLLPNTFVEHTSFIQQLEELCVPHHAWNSSNTEAHVLLYGLMGSGKRTLALAISHTKMARTHYAQRGGQFSITLTPTSRTTHDSLELNISTLASLKSLIKLVLNHASDIKLSNASSGLIFPLNPFCTSVQEAKHQLTTYFSSLDENSSTLLFIHGVSSIHQMSAFYFSPHECPHLRIVFTTDSFALTESISSGGHNMLLSMLPMKPFSVQSANQLLSVKTGIIQSKLPSDICSEIAEYATYSPLALCIIASILSANLEHNKTTQLDADWQDTLRELRNSPGFKTFITKTFSSLHPPVSKSISSHIPQDNIVPLYDCALRAVAYSAQQLEDDSPDIYEALQHLVVFKEGERVPILIVRLLWQQIGIVEGKAFWNTLHVLSARHLIVLHVFQNRGDLRVANGTMGEWSESMGPVQGDGDVSRRESYFVSLHPLVFHYLHCMSQNMSREVRKVDPSARLDCDLVSKHLRLLAAFARVTV